MKKLSAALAAGLVCVMCTTAAFADMPAPPPLPPPPSPPSPPPSPPSTPSTPSSSPSASSSQGSSGSRWKVTGESIMLWQGGAVVCSSGTLIIDSQIKARHKPVKIRGHKIKAKDQLRELTPLEAIDDSARCTFIPAMIVSLGSRLVGMHDNACSYDVARRARIENDSPRAREELLWRDGSWERRQAKFNSEYFDCYHGITHKKHIKVFRRKRLTS